MQYTELKGVDPRTHDKFEYFRTLVVPAIREKV